MRDWHAYCLQHNEFSRHFGDSPHLRGECPRTGRYLTAHRPIPAPAGQPTPPIATDECGTIDPRARRGCRYFEGGAASQPHRRTDARFRRQQRIRRSRRRAMALDRNPQRRTGPPRGQSIHPLGRAVTAAAASAGQAGRWVKHAEYVAGRNSPGNSHFTAHVHPQGRCFTDHAPIPR